MFSRNDDSEDEKGDDDEEEARYRAKRERAKLLSSSLSV